VLDDHYVTVSDPTTVRHLLAARSVSVALDSQTQTPRHSVAPRTPTTSAATSGTSQRPFSTTTDNNVIHLNRQGTVRRRHRRRHRGFNVA